MQFGGIMFLAVLLEMIVGILLILTPTLVVKLMLGVEIDGAAVVISRFAGIALLSLGVASLRPLQGLLTYNVLATLFFAYLGWMGQWVGIFLWPVVFLHLALSIYFVWKVGR